MKPPRDVIRFIRTASIGTNDPADAQVRQRMGMAYDGCDSVQAAGHLGAKVARLAMAAAILIAAGALVGRLARFAGGSVAWADVTRQFQTVPFFSVSIYMKENAVAEPTQMELWMSQDRRLRLQMGRRVTFAHQGRVRTYDVVSRRPAEPDGLAWFFMEKIRQTREFSLQAIIEAMFGGRMTEVTPLINPDAVISQDMVVFDVEPADKPERVRIWALRESRLPIRIAVSDPRGGASTDAVFTYFREEPAEFLDPNAFENPPRDRAPDSQVNAASLH